MKRVISVILLLVFLFSNIGFYFLVLALESGNREEVRASLDQGDISETIRIPKSEAGDIIFSDDTAEFLFNGEMYDLIDSTDDDNDEIILKCIPDKKETKLRAALTWQIKSNYNPSSTSEKKQNDFSKNRVKDLFCSEKNILSFSSGKIEFSSGMGDPASYIPSISPPPPNVWIA